MNWEKYSKEDRKFLIELSINNRNYLASIYLGLYTLLFSFSALMISLYSFYLSFAGLKKESFTIGAIILLLIVLSWIIIPKILQSIIHTGVKNLNKQYQEIHKTIHPELFRGDYYY
ncbi:hypothetical protein GYA25_03530 [Candidatus Woesearchaeota archaeon]|nr:hypothetical protein [Candidatus Woesearchaeota archaeon]